MMNQMSLSSTTGGNARGDFMLNRYRIQGIAFARQLQLGTRTLDSNRCEFFGF